MQSALTTSGSSNVQRDDGPLPIWLSIPVILICLAGGGWIIHWYVMTDPIAHESKILGDPGAQPPAASFGGQGPNGGPGVRLANRGSFAGNQRRFIRTRGPNVWEAHTEQARIDASIQNGQVNWHIISYTGNYAFVDDSVKETIYAARALVNDNARLAATNLPPAQVNKLRGLISIIYMNLSDTDKKDLGAKLVTYVQASDTAKQSLEGPLLQFLDEVAQRSIPATRELANRRAAEINSIVTPAMWKHDATMGGIRWPLQSKFLRIFHAHP